MPFKSNAERKWMFANHPQMAREFQSHTPSSVHLPEHVSHSKGERPPAKPRIQLPKLTKPHIGKPNVFERLNLRRR